MIELRQKHTKLNLTINDKNNSINPIYCTMNSRKVSDYLNVRIVNKQFFYFFVPNFELKIQTFQQKKNPANLICLFVRLGKFCPIC